MIPMTTQAMWQAAELAEKEKNLWRAIELYSQILSESAPDVSGTATQQIRLKALSERGRLLALAGEAAAALAGYEQYYRETRYGQDTVEALLLIGWQCTRMGLYDRAYTALESALTQATDLQFTSGRARALARLGAYWQELGRYTEALRYLEQAELLVEYVETSRGRMRITNALGNAHLGLGQLDKAIVAYNRALTHARLVGEEETAMVLNNLSETYQALYDMEQAYHYQKEAMTLIQDITFSQVRSDLFRNMGAVLCQLRRIEEGLNYLQQALTLSRSLKQINVEMQTLYSLALAELARHDVAAAQEHTEALITLAQQYQSKALLSSGLYTSGLIHQQKGEIAQAQSIWQQAIFLAHESGNRILLWRIHAALAEVTAEASLAQVHRSIAADVLFQMAQPIADMNIRRKFLSSPPVRPILMAVA